MKKLEYWNDEMNGRMEWRNHGMMAEEISIWIKKPVFRYSSIPRFHLPHLCVEKKMYA